VTTYGGAGDASSSDAVTAEPAAADAGAGAADPTPPVAVVTGAGRGIGRATALRLARAGHDLALCALEEDEVAAVAAEARALGRRALAAAFDVADADAIATFVAEARDVLGPATSLVANAGTILLPDDARSASAERWDRTLAVNARAAYLACAAVLPDMRRAGRGRIVTVASTAGLRGLPRRLAYVASKHALVGLTLALAEEVEAPGITVNAVCPGAVRTRLTEGSRPDADRRGWLAPDEVAATIAWLLGPDAGHVHGAVLELADRSGG
jgi:NAD(P)-dependent dehydrogenase (short-subunit alcohol dehydrogenase family)